MNVNIDRVMYSHTVPTRLEASPVLVFLDIKVTDFIVKVRYFNFINIYINLLHY